MQQRTLPSNGRLDPGGSDVIDILEQDHQAIKNLLADLNTAPKRARGEVLEALKQLLTVHCTVEENLVYPAIHEIAKRPMHAVKLYHQQDEAKIVLWTLDQLSPEDEEFEKKAAKLRDAVIAHIDLEENDEFPRLREAAGGQMTALTAAARVIRDGFSFDSDATEAHT
jgi:hemerythrin superfamily protein